MKMAFLLPVVAAAALATPALARSVEKAPPPAPYQEVCKLVKLPCFLPGLGTLYVNPKALPAGPFLAYDHKNRLVSTIYMIPLSDLDSHKMFKNLPAPSGKVDHVSLYFNAGHPGVPMPHYHIILWHSKMGEARVAK